MSRRYREQGFAAVGTILAAVAILAISAGAGTYLSLQQKDRFSENEVITALKQQTTQFRNTLISNAPNNEEMASIEAALGNSDKWPDTDRAYAFGSSQLPAIYTVTPPGGGGGGGGVDCGLRGCDEEDDPRGGDSGGDRGGGEERGGGSEPPPKPQTYNATLYYTTPASHKTLYAAYVENPRLRLRYAGEDDPTDPGVVVTNARYAKDMDADFSKAVATGVSPMAFFNEPQGIGVFVDAKATLTGSAVNPHFQHKTLEKLVQLFGVEATFCERSTYHRAIIWIIKVPGRFSEICDF